MVKSSVTFTYFQLVIEYKNGVASAYAPVTFSSAEAAKEYWEENYTSVCPLWIEYVVESIDKYYDTPKRWHVILTSLVDASRDSEEDSPETKEYRFDIYASSKDEAVDLAKKRHPHSVWESDAYED